jgi:hypothetical protein
LAMGDEKDEMAARWMTYCLLVQPIVHAVTTAAENPAALVPEPWACGRADLTRCSSP